MAELEKKLARRLEESIQTRNTQQAEIKQLQAELQKLLTKIPRRPRESIAQLDQNIRDLERKRTITSMSLAEERLILKEINGIQKAKSQVEEYESMERKVQAVKMKLDELKTGQKTQRESIQEIETGLSKVKLANQLGCEMQELTTITVECPKDKLGYIIGKQGGRIQQLMDTHKVTIDVSKDTCIATITGGAAAVKAAKSEIESISHSIETEITLPAVVVAYLMGSHIDALANIKSKYEDLYLDIIRGANKAAIRGAPERVEAAKQELLTLNVTSETRTLVGKEFNYLLGRKGARIDELVQTHKVVIDVTKNKAEDTATAVVSGPPSQVAETMEAIQELMDSNREVSESIAVDPVLRQILLVESGKQIKAIQSKVNEKLKEEDESLMCHLSFSKDRGVAELQVKVKQSAIECATMLTEEALKELQDLIVTFTVDTYIVPTIIGKGGETIKKLTYGKPLFLEVDRTSGKVIVGATTAEGRDSILAEVQKIVENNHVLRIPGDPELMKSQYRELGRSKTKAALQELARLDIDETNSVFILRGKQENLDKAKAVFQEYLASNSFDEIKILDEDFNVLLAGGKESKIMKLSEELGVNLKANQSQGTITLRGPAENVAKAKNNLDVFLNGGDGQSVAKISASDQVVGSIIGKGGKILRDLETTYSVAINISKTHRVSIRGPEEKVQECRVEILKMLSSARVAQVVSISSEQEAKLEKNEALKRIAQETHSQLSIADGKVTIRGVFHDVREAASLLNEKLTGEYKSSIELGPTQFARVSSTCRDPSHLDRIQSATDTVLELLKASGEIQIAGKRSNVRKGKEQLYDFLAFVCPGEFMRLKVTKPLYMTIGQPTLLAEVAAAVGGSSIYLDRDVGSIVIRDADAGKVKAAAEAVSKNIMDAERLAYVLEIAPNDAWLITYLLGNGRIQSLRKGSDCFLDVSKESRTITVTGESEEKVNKVREKLDALVAKARCENVFVDIPEKAIPSFMGHGGKKVKDLSKEYDVEIQRERKSCQFKIIGNETKVANAKKFVDEWIETWQEGTASLEVSIDKQFVSAILGEKGGTARALEKEFECKIDINREALKVTIRGGDKEKRQNTLVRINEIIAQEAAVRAERAAKKKESLSKEDSKNIEQVPADDAAAPLLVVPAPAISESNEQSQKVNSSNSTKEKKVQHNPFPSKPVGTVSPIKKEAKPPSKKNAPAVAVSSGTEQGRNLFNLLLEG